MCDRVAGIDINLSFFCRSSARMGGLCSKSGTLQGGHQVIGTTRALGGGDGGGGGKDSIPVNPRQAALDAAERRKQAVRFSFVG